MTNFNADAFMIALRKKLPSATISCKTRTADEKAVMLENVKVINNQYNHAPALGSGALQNRGNS
ncbi:MAG: hypothetical protein WAW61_22315 [Methylococcaceae bacterium]